MTFVELNPDDKYMMRHMCRCSHTFVTYGWKTSVQSLLDQGLIESGPAYVSFTITQAGADMMQVSLEETRSMRWSSLGIL